MMDQASQPRRALHSLAKAACASLLSSLCLLVDKFYATSAENGPTWALRALRVRRQITTLMPFHSTRIGMEFSPPLCREGCQRCQGGLRFGPTATC